MRGNGGGTCRTSPTARCLSCRRSRRSPESVHEAPAIGAVSDSSSSLGETLTQAVRREVMEEAGIAVEATGLVGVFSNPHHIIEFTDGEIRQEFSICFRARPTGGQATRVRKPCGRPPPTSTRSTSTRPFVYASATASKTGRSRTTRRHLDCRGHLQRADCRFLLALLSDLIKRVHLR